jgi:hypothetical protein
MVGSVAGFPGTASLDGWPKVMNLLTAVTEKIVCGEIWPSRLIVGWFFLNVTTCETKIGLLLIEIFERQFNPHDYGHLITGGHFSFRYQGTKKPHGNPRGFLANLM